MGSMDSEEIIPKRKILFTFCSLFLRILSFLLIYLLYMFAYSSLIFAVSSYSIFFILLILRNRKIHEHFYDFILSLLLVSGALFYIEENPPNFISNFLYSLNLPSFLHLRLIACDPLILFWFILECLCFFMFYIKKKKRVRL